MLNKCHIVHSVPFVTSALACLPWLYVGVALTRDPRMYRKYSRENKARVLTFGTSCFKTVAETYFGRSFSYFRDFWESFDIFVRNCLFFEV